MNTSELLQCLDEAITHGERVIRAAKAIRRMLADEPEPAHRPETPAESCRASVETPQAGGPKKYAFAEVREACSAKHHAGYTAQVKALIAKYGADKLSGVKEEDYPKLMKDLEAIA